MKTFRGRLKAFDGNKAIFTVLLYLITTLISWGETPLPLIPHVPFKRPADLANKILRITAKLEEFDYRSDPKGHLSTTVNIQSSFSLADSSKLRVECSPYTLTDKDVPGGYISKNFTFVYDGEKWITLFSGGKQGIDTFKTQEITISDEKPGFLGSTSEGYVTGQSFFFDTMNVFKSLRFPDLEKFAAESKVLHSSVETTGTLCRIKVNDPCDSTEATFRVDRQYAPVSLTKRENLCNEAGQKVTIIYDFGEAVEFPKIGLSVPCTLTRTFQIDGAILNKTTVTVTDVTFENRSPGELYEFKVAPGWIVTDERHNTMGSRPEDLW